MRDGVVGGDGQVSVLADAPRHAAIDVAEQTTGVRPHVEGDVTDSRLVAQGTLPGLTLEVSLQTGKSKLIVPAGASFKTSDNVVEANYEVIASAGSFVIAQSGWQRGWPIGSRVVQAQRGANVLAANGSVVVAEEGANVTAQYNANVRGAADGVARESWLHHTFADRRTWPNIFTEVAREQTTRRFEHQWLRESRRQQPD